MLYKNRLAYMRYDNNNFNFFRLSTNYLSTETSKFPKKITKIQKYKKNERLTTNKIKIEIIKSYLNSILIIIPFLSRELIFKDY